MESNSFKWNFIGNHDIVRFLEKTISNDTVSHAYLISGPAKSGKKTLVDQFLRILFCFKAQAAKKTQSKGTASFPCGECAHCRQIEKRVHPDICFVDRLRDEKTEKLKKNISIEQIRRLQEQLHSGTFLNLYHVGLIYNADLLSLEAANSLLKMLEEPHRNTMFILVAQQPDSLPTTVLSRCQRFTLRPVSGKTLYNYAREKFEVTPDVAITWSKLSYGLPGKLHQFARDPLPFKKHQSEVNDLFKLLSGDTFQRLTQLDDFFSGKKDHQEGAEEMEERLQTWSLVVRDLILARIFPEGSASIMNLWCVDTINSLSKEFSIEFLRRFYDQIEETKQKLPTNANTKLLLDHLFLSLS